MDDYEEELARKDQLIRHRQHVWMLSLAGFIPFGLAALLLALLGTQNALADPLVAIFRAWSVIILTFLGGIRWGHALPRSDEDVTPADTTTLWLSVAPALAAWATMFAGDQLAISLLLILFCAQGAWDSFSAHADRLPAWFAPVRMTLTGLVAFAHAVVMMLLVQG